MWKVIQNYLLTNTKEESRNIEMKNPCLKAGSSVIKKGSQKEAENEAAEDSDDSRLRDSTQAFEQRNPQIKEDSEDSEDPDEYEDPEDSEDSEDSEDPEDSDDLDDLRWRDSTQTNEQKGSQISSQISLHCYRTCKKYTECCPIPDKCRQLSNEAKMCPIRQLFREHGCGYMDILPENELDEINQHRELKLKRHGMTEDGLKVREPRDYTPDEAFEVLYAVETSQNSVYTDDEWREEDDSRYFREGGFGVEEVEKPETEVEEYVMEDPYDEVKRFSDLTEDEVDTVLQKLKGVSTKYATMFRPEIRGGEEDRRFLKELEKLVTSIDLIFLVMPLTEEFKRRKEVEQRSQNHHSANSSVRAISEVDERRQIQCSEVGSD